MFLTLLPMLQLPGFDKDFLFIKGNITSGDSPYFSRFLTASTHSMTTFLPYFA